MSLYCNLEIKLYKCFYIFSDFAHIKKYYYLLNGKWEFFLNGGWF